MMISRAFLALASTLVASVSAPVSAVSTLTAQEPAARAPDSKPAPARNARPHGATQATEKAVLDGMRWLVRHQNPDGSWSAATLGERCAKESRCFDEHDAFSDRYDPAATGLALLCFLRAGFTAESKQDIVDTVLAKRHKVGEVVKSGLQALVRRQRADGSFSSGRSFVYNEAIATMALVEAYSRNDGDAWKDAGQRGVDFLESAQRQSPHGDSLWGWRFDSRLDAEIDARNAGRDASPELAHELSNSDSASTALCAFVLRAAQDKGLAVKKESLAGALAFTRAMTGELGEVAYRDARIPDPFVATTHANFVDHPALLSAFGMCTRMSASSDANDPFLDVAAKRVIADLPSVSADKSSIDYAYWYWGSLALHDLDGPDSPRKSGKYWRAWHEAMTTAIVSLQDHSAGSCRNGGWIAPDRWSFALGPIYTTAMSILALEVEYRMTGALRRRVQPTGEVGMRAPPIDRVDANGDPFVLASSAGKVVVLDSWASDELPDSVALNLRDQLLERFKDRPLVLVGICMCSGADMVVPPIARDRRATWRWIQAKNVKDPLLVDYGLAPGNTIVIDAGGVIRMRDETWPVTVKRIEELVSQAEKK